MRHAVFNNLSNGLVEGPLPFYYQIVHLIRHEILSGTWPLGSRLPTEQNMANQVGASQPTIRQFSLAI